MHNPSTINHFWFADAVDDAMASKRRAKYWYRGGPALDKKIQQQFGPLVEQAAKGQLKHWHLTPSGSLALVILLDQFSRHIYRKTANAFNNDSLALQYAKLALSEQQDTELSFIERAFLYHPFHHTENLIAQNQAVELFTHLVEDASLEWRVQLQSFLNSAIQHRSIVERFGRFPHRNRALDRPSTAEEKDYLGQSTRSFGQ
ncbi:MAG: DUF924 domain-containing protein [Pseudomonadales bacterium]|nr:DUF924 domain-containing protein [Pseudomonadales bacterium]